MPNTNLEVPRPIENDGEEHLACALLVDTSGSMAGYEEQMIHAIDEIKAAIESNPMARGRVELCLIFFDDQARVIQPFGPMRTFTPPTSLSMGGMTATHQAVDMAVNLVTERTQYYEREHIAFKKPWIWLFTDGGSNDPDNGSFSRLLELQREGTVVFYGVGIGDKVNGEELKGMHKKHMMLAVDRKDFAAAFEFFSKSARITSVSQRGKEVVVDLPPQLRIET